MPLVNDTTKTELLWEKCRRRGLRMLVIRCDPVANGRADHFVVKVLHPERDASVAEVRTTNIESAATLILDRYESHLQ